MSSVGGIGGGGAMNASALRDIMNLRQQIIDRSQLLQQVHTAPTTGPGAAGASDGSGSFTGALKTALDGVSATQNRAEALSAAYEKGQVTDVASVMLARQEASVGFEATLQVRNKLLGAYQDIMKLGV